MAKLKGLGRGLDALLAGIDDKPSNDVLRQLPIGRLQPGRYQPRTRMDEASLTELAGSIRTQGIMQPILVRPIDGDRFEIIAGERRWRAARQAGLEEVPALVRVVADHVALALSLIENIQREDLNPLEEAQGIARLIEEFGLTHEAAALAIGRSRSAVSNLLRLASLAKPVQDMLLANRIEMGHARALLALAPGAQVSAASRIADEGLSVRDAERLVQTIVSPGRPPKARNRKLPSRGRGADLARLEEELSESLGAIVRIEPTREGAGRVLIRYSSLEELDGILARLK